MHDHVPASRHDQLDGGTGQRLLSTLMQLDDHLGRLTYLLALQSQKSPLQTWYADITPLQQRRLAQDIQRLHGAMSDILGRHGLAIPPPSGSVLQACCEAVHQAVAAVEALTPGSQAARVRSSDDTEAELRRIIAHLLAPLDEMLRPLEQHDANFHSDDRNLEYLFSIARAHGLSDFYAPLTALADHESAPGLVIAMLGLSNAGKSSLINRLVGVQLLPVGVMPTSVVPVHISYGARACGVVRLSNSVSEPVMPGRLAAFASDRYNPGNEKLVERLSFELPSQHLADGIVLIDSPPWAPGMDPPLCDVALVVIDATGPLTMSEIPLVDALTEQGSQAIVLLNKADRLTDQQRWDILGYVLEHLGTRHEQQPTVFLTSAGDEDSALWHDWLQRGFAPCLERREALRQTSLHTKRAHLSRAMALRLARLNRTDSSPNTETSHENEAILLAQREGLDLLATASQSMGDCDLEAHIQAARIIRQVVNNAAELAWSSGETTLELAPMFAASAEARMTSVCHEVMRELELLALQCSDLLARTPGPQFRWHVADLDTAPTFDPGNLPQTEAIARPWSASLGPWAFRWHLRWSLSRDQRLLIGLEAALGEDLKQLQDWRQRALVDLSNAFSQACAGRCEGAARIGIDLAGLQARYHSIASNA
ncbi:MULTISPECIES: dynamin family protein [Alcaligenaceae]|nr:dynamin family protein [Eoetvoesiella caeni]MCI2810364.1 dynamin family protein [Eoetvoesiella caeni]